ncbi:MAG: hypothetical protein ACP5HX_07375 [Thermoproteota archaeon]
MEKRTLLYPILAILLGILIVALPSFFLRNSNKEVGFTPLTTLSRNNTEAREANKSKATTTSTSYFTESLDLLQKLLLMLLVPLALAYFAFRFAKSKL